MALRNRDPEYMQLLKERQAQRIAAQPQDTGGTLNAENITKLEDDLGVGVNESNFTDFISGSYSKADLARAGVDQSVQDYLNNLRVEAQPYEENVRSMRASIPKGLQGLEFALRAKQGSFSKPQNIYDMAGLGTAPTAGSVMRALSQYANESKARYTTFQNALLGASTAASFEFNANLQNARDINSEIDKITGRLDDLLADQRSLDNQLTLQADKARIDKELEKYKSDLKFAEGAGTRPDLLTPKTGAYGIAGKQISSLTNDGNTYGIAPAYSSSTNPNGVDILIPMNTQIVAPQDAELIYSGSAVDSPFASVRGAGWGNQVILKYADGTYGVVNHLSKAEVEAIAGLSKTTSGEYEKILGKKPKIKKGTVLGYSGNTGNVQTEQDDGTYAAVTEEQRKQGKGAHVDYTKLDPNGNILDWGKAYGDLVGAEEILLPEAELSETAQALRNSENFMSVVREGTQIGKLDRDNLLAAYRGRDGYNELSAALNADYSALVTDEELKLIDTYREKFKMQDEKVAEAGIMFDALAQGDIDRAKEMLISRIESELSVAESAKFTGALGMIYDLAYLDEAYKKLEKKTGLVGGTLEDMWNKIGYTRDPELAQIKRETERITQAYTQSQTGAQFSAAEMARYASLFPRIGNTATLNQKEIDALLNSTIRITNNLVRGKTGQRFNNIFEIIPEYAIETYIPEGFDPSGVPELVKNFEKNTGKSGGSSVEKVETSAEDAYLDSLQY